MSISNRKIKILLNCILDAIHIIQGYTKLQDDKSFFKDTKTQDACLMQITHIGEMAKRMMKQDPQFHYFDIKPIVGMRDYIVHDYLGVDEEILRNTIQKDLPILEKVIKDLLTND